MKKLGIVVAAATLLAAGQALAHRNLAEVTVYDRSEGTWLQVYRHQGRAYVVGKPGHEYQIRVANRLGEDLLAVVSVDGVNVITGQTAHPSQSGYVLSPRASLDVQGWRRSLSQTAAFYFTALPDSYAARTGRPGDVGVIGVALFREKTYAPPPPPPRPCCWPWHRELDDSDHRSAPSADSAAGASAPAEAEEARRDRAEPPSTSASRPQKKAERLGTGHGERLDSAAQRVEFERASDTPEEVIAIWYDTRANLVAQGILPR